MSWTGLLLSALSAYFFDIFLMTVLRSFCHLCCGRVFYVYSDMKAQVSLISDKNGTVWRQRFALFGPGFDTIGWGLTPIYKMRYKTMTIT